MEQMLFSFVFPNERVYWGILIVIYPFIVYAATGSFFVSTLYRLFKKEALKPVANLALLSSLAFLAFASAPHLLHLGHPERSFNIMFTPSMSSAMATFGYIYGLYLGIVVLELWFVFRPKIVEASGAATGLKRTFYSILALGVKDISENASRVDKGIVKLLAFFGIPVSCILAGYVGFLFGSLESVPLWSSPLIPVTFLLSAAACGIGFSVVLYFVAMKTRKSKVDPRCIRSLSVYLWSFLLLSGVLQLLNFIHSTYGTRPDWRFAFETLRGEFPFSLIGLQLIAGLIVPFVLLSAILLFKAKGALRNTLAVISSVLVLVHVLAFLWNLIIGGQLASRTLRGVVVFEPEFLGKEGILAAAIILICPFVFLYILTKILPPFGKKAEVNE